MVGSKTVHNDFSLYGLRRKDLIARIKEQHPDRTGVVILFADFEIERIAFRQESSFYYYTGLKEPGLALVLNVADGTSTLYTPNCVAVRNVWVNAQIALTQENAKTIGVDHITPLGSACVSYQFHPFFPQTEYQTLLDMLKQTISRDQAIFTLCPNKPSGYIPQRYHLTRLCQMLPELARHVVDVSALVAEARRRKDHKEIELLYKAIEITALAQEAAAHAITAGATEAEVKASLEYIMIGSQALLSFPSIVATGKNTTVLHYQPGAATLKDGDLVVVDIGAEYEYYCADITRTYPVSGKFTKRQREIYDMVLETQAYIAGIAKPGYWLSNKDHPEQSLNHIAKKYLEERGYGKYFPHGIGHYVGLDVHDVGDYATPLQEGDVFTIEPGIYIPEEGIGVRIEDNYWVVKDGVVCLSEGLPKEPEEIESMVQASF